MPEAEARLQTRRRPPMDVEATAQYLGTTERQVRRLVHERKIPHAHIGAKLRLMPDRIDAWVEAQSVEPEAR